MIMVNPQNYLSHAMVDSFGKGWTPEWAPISDGSAEPEIYNQMKGEQSDGTEGTSPGTKDAGR